MSKKNAPKTRSLPLNALELRGLHSLYAELQAAQQRFNDGFHALALAHGQEPAKLRYQVSDDGKTLNLIDQE